MMFLHMGNAKSLSSWPIKPLYYMYYCVIETLNLNPVLINTFPLYHYTYSLIPYINTLPHSSTHPHKLNTFFNIHIKYPSEPYLTPRTIHQNIQYPKQ